MAKRKGNIGECMENARDDMHGEAGSNAREK